MVRFFLLFFGLIFIGANSFCTIKESETKIDQSNILSYKVNLKKQNLKFYWKDNADSLYRNFRKLKLDLKNNGQELLFAMNGGMYTKQRNPQGLFIQNGKLHSKLDTATGFGNFYLHPNGVFYITNNNLGGICETNKFGAIKNIKFATQSGPMLLINGLTHSKLNQGSKNLNIRNGVGVLPNGNLLFAMSKDKINFYDFANFFKVNGCRNALYLDGFVSRTYLPAKNWQQLDGNFGVIIGETKTL